MANDKKFIVKNGLLTQESIVVGSTTYNTTDKLQVTGSSSFSGAVDVSQSSNSVITLSVTNDGGDGSTIAEFNGGTAGLKITQEGTGDYSIYNSAQQNGLLIYNDAAGLDIVYNGNTDISFTAGGIDFKREPSYNGNVFWNAGNDGSGSGLDADLIDGLDSTQFLRSDESDTMTGDLTINGNLTVNGNTTYVNTETILLSDNILTLNANHTGAPTQDAGWEVNRGSLANSGVLWDETNDWFKLNSAGTDLGRIITTADEGPGNGFDADTVDGLQAEQFLRSDADDFATGNITFRATITVGNNTASGATIYMDGQNANRAIYSTNGEIGFLNSSLAFGAYSDTSSNWRVLNDVYGKRFIDADDNNYLVDPAGTSAINNIDLVGSIRHSGDTDTYITFPAENQIEFRANNAQKLLIDPSYISASVEVRAPKFVDSDDNNYYADPASASVFNTLGIDSDLFHNGDANTKLSFATDVITLETNGTAKLTANSTAVASSVDLYAPRLVDADDNNYYLDPNGVSVLSSADFYNGSTTANNVFNIGRSAAERFNIEVTDSQGYIRYYQDEPVGTPTDHSVNFEIISGQSSSRREFRFNSNIDIGTNSIIGTNGLFSGAVYGEVFYDYTDQSYFADFNGTGISINVAGSVRAGDGSLSTPTYGFVNDVNTGMYSYAADTIGFSAGGNDEFRIYNTYTLSVGASRAPVFEDSDDTAYYGNFAGTSQMSRIDLDDYIQHRGNTTTYIGFPANNQFVVYTNGASRLSIVDASSTFSNNTYAPRFYTDDYLYHNGDDSYIGFSSNDTAVIATANTVRFTVNTTSVTSTLNTYAPRFYTDDYLYHNGDNSYIGFSANDTAVIATDNTVRVTVNTASVTSTLDVYAPTFFTDDYLVHNGDTNTYVGFDAADQFGIWTNGTKRINVASNGETNIYYRAVIGNSLTRPDDLSDLTNSAAKIGGSDVHLHIASLSTTGNFAVAMQAGRESDNANFPLALQPNGGNIGVGTLTPGGLLSINRPTAFGPNPFAAGQKYLTLGDDGTEDFSLRGTSLRDVWAVMESTGTFTFTDSNANFLPLSVDFATSDVVIGDQYAAYTVTDNTSVIDGPTPGTPRVISNNLLHVNGSIQLNGNNDAIVFGRGTSTFLMDEELGFGWGGGLYMTDATTMYVRGGVDFSTAGNIYAARYYDVDDTAYYTDPASTSIMSRIDIDDYIRHNGDTNTYIGFDTADTFKVWTGGTQRLNIDNDSADFAVNVYAPRYYDSDDDAYYVDPASTSIMSRIDVDDYIRHNGDTNTYLGFSAADTIVAVTGGATRLSIDTDSADFSVNVYAPRYYDSNDPNFYGDFAATSIMARITMPQNTVGVQFASNANVPDYYIGQGMGDNDGWKIYGESPAGTNTGALIIQAEDDYDGNESIRHRFKKTYSPYDTRDNLITYFDHVYTPTEFRAPRFVDANDNAYYGDFAGTSLTNVMRANQFQIDGSTYTIDSPSGTYGSIKVQGQKGGWGGYAIYDDWVFMSNGSAEAGIFNDTRNEWAIKFFDNASTEIYFNGTKEAETKGGYFLANNQMRAPIYYAPNATTYWLDLDVANTSEALRIPGKIFRQNFDTGSNGDNNKLLEAQDYSHWIWNTSTNWGIFWAGNDNPAYRYFGTTNPNELVFVGSGATKASIDLDNGNAYFAGEVIGSNFRINGGNEDLPILKTYGSGHADDVLFDGTMYWEKRVIKTMQGAENNATGTTAEYVKVPDGPFSSSYALQTSGYRDFYSDYIEVEPGEEVYGEMSVKYVSGSGGLFYYGIERFDKDKRPIAGNTGTVYFVGSASNVTSPSWQTFSGYHTIPTSHTPYNGSDGGGVKYIRIRILMNYNSGGAVRQFGPPILKRANTQTRIRTPEVFSAGDVNAGGNVYGKSFIDTDDSTYFVDPSATGTSARLRGTIYIDGDNNDTWLDMKSTSNGYGRIRMFARAGDPVIEFSDASNSSGQDQVWAIGADDRNTGSFVIRWNNSTLFPNDWTSYGSEFFQLKHNGNLSLSGGEPDSYRLQIGGTGYASVAFRAPSFIDHNDPNYYGDFASTSVFNQAIYTNSIPLRFSTTSTAIFDHYSNSTPVAFDMRKSGSSFSDSSSYGVLSLTRTNHNNSASAAGGGLYFQLKDSGGTLREYAGILGRKTVSGTGGGELRFMTYGRSVRAYLNSSYFAHNSEIRGTLFRDGSSTSWYMDPSNFSSLYTVRAADAFRSDRWEEYGGAFLFRDGVGAGPGRHLNLWDSTGDPSVADGGLTGITWGTRSDNQPYYLIYADRETYGGYNYSRLHLNWHTGIQIGASKTYGGTRFFNDARRYGSGGGLIFTIGDGDDNVRSLADIYAKRFVDYDNAAYYVDPASTSNLNALILGGYEQNNPLTGRWYSQTPYNWNGSTLRYYWIRVGRISSGTASGSFEYYAKRDFNYPGYVHGIVTVSTYTSSSMSVQHDLLTSDGQMGPQVWVDDSRYVWLRMDGCAWSSYLRWRWTYNSGCTIETGSTVTLSQPSTAQVVIPGKSYRMAFNDATAININYDSPNIVNRLDAHNSVRAPIFYDSNNTGYYVDPNGTSQFSRVNLNNNLYVQSGSTAHFYTGAGNLRGYIQATDTDDAHLIIATSGGEDISFRDGGQSGQWNMVVRGDGNVLTLNTSYATRFEDRADSAYYVDPNSYSSLRDLRATEFYARNWFRNDNSGEGIYNQSTGQHFYSDNNDGWNVAGGGSANWIRFRDSYGGTVRGYVYANNSSQIGFLNSSGSWIFRANSSGTTEIYGDLYANRLIDRNSPGYVVDPAGNSRLNYVNANYIKDDSSPNYGGLYFDERSYSYIASSGSRSQIIGTGLAIVSGYSSGANRPFTYDITASFNASGIGFEIAADWVSSTGTPLRVRSLRDCCQGWTPWTDIATQKFSFTNDVDLRAPIFYDSNDSAYRWDGTSTNGSRFRGVHYETMAYMGLSGQTRSSKEYYAARPRITSNGDYWTGNMGWGTVDMNTVMDWGAGFIDSWSNPANQPSGTSHWVGVQSFHFTNGSTRYGWQMVGGPIANLRFRQQWGSAPGAWRTIPMINVNDGNSGTLYASSFADADDAGYYVNPNSTGTSYRGRGQIFLGPNTSSRYLRLGGNGGSTDHSTISASNGNLHIDAQAGYNLYLGWYNASDIYFGGRLQVTTIRDRTNSAYYIDMNSVSNVNDFRANIFRDRASTSYYLNADSSQWRVNTPSGYVRIGPANSSWAHYTTDRANHYFNTGVHVNGDIYRYATSNRLSNTGMYANYYGDTNSSAYYMDPSSYSSFYRGRFYNYNGSVSSANAVSLEIANAAGTGDGGVAAMSWHCRNYYATHMHLRHDGYFGMGGWSASTWRWYVYMPNGSATFAGDVAAYSDPRLKEEIRPIENALEKIRSVNGVKFRWIDSSVIGKPGEEDYGILANEIQKIAPELVYDSIHDAPEGDKYKTVAYDKLTPILIEAIKEQQDIIESQEESIKALNARVEDQQSVIDDLAKKVEMLMKKMSEL